MSISRGPKIVTNGLSLAMDAADMNSYSPNVIPNPTDVFANIGTEIQSCTISRDTNMIRQQGSIPMKMSVTGNDSYAGKYGYPAANLASALSGQTWTISVWAKASVATDGQLFIFGADTNGAVFVSPDYSAGTLAITTSWQRFSFSYTFTNANTRYIQFRLDGTNSGGSGITIWWDGLQVERSSTATPFNPNYYGDTVWKDLSGNNYTGTLTNGPSFNSNNKGTIVFPGNIDNRVQTNYGPTFTDFTISLWFKDNNSVQYARLLDKSYTGGFWLGRNASIASSWGGGILESSSPYGIFLTLTDGQWHFLTSIRSGTTHTLYGDGITNTTSNTVSSTALNTTTLAIGGWSGGVGSQQFTGNISNVLFYNRALTADEVLQNYNAQKSRFGL